VRAQEREATAGAQACSVVTEAEAKLLRRNGSEGRVVVVPCGVDLEYFRPGDVAAGECVVFVGALNYEPNIDGIGWFCQYVWPRLRALRLGATLKIVGRRPAPRVRRLAALPGVEVVADVPDIRPYLADAMAVVVPLRVARGVQNKLLEALAMGKPAITSPAALGGVGAQPERDLLCADTAEDWRMQLERVFDEPRLRDSLAVAGRRYVERHHCWNECLSAFDEMLGLNEPRTKTERLAEAVGL
jgi:glycosyltransferase involved in cell wall biosynthesis